MDWQVYTRGTIPLLRLSHCFEAIRDDAGTYLVPFKHLLYLNIGDRLRWAWSKKEMRAAADVILTLMKDPGKRHKHFEKMRAVAEEAMASSDDVRAADLSSLSDNSLVGFFHKHYTREKAAQAWMNVEIDAVDLYPAKHLKEQIFSELPDSLSSKEKMNIFSRMTAPSYMSYVTQEEIAMLEILKSGSDDIRKILEQFWWTSLGFEGLHPKTEVDVRRTLDEYAADIEDPEKAIVERLGAPGRIEQERNTLIGQYSISAQTVEMILAFDEYAEMHDVRKEMQVKALYGFRLLVVEAARRLGVDPDLLEWFTLDEICEFIEEKRFPEEEAKRRVQATFMLLDNGTLSFHSGDEAVRLGEKELGINIEHTEKIEGIGASPGIARGIARVCNGVKEALEKVRSGDILICGMTLPEYVPAMRRAAAIVTDEGGVTCHAAIIGRELGKPVVVGTQLATRVFKDGMLLEVDADSGSVKRV